jgi:cytosine/adenosine deaminase-related metal-dependent hydrolase
MEEPFELTGHALVGREFEIAPVRIRVEAGIIASIEEERSPDPVWICPAFFNAHTHLGDTVAMDIPVDGDLASLVTPPDGLKHQLLLSASAETIEAGIRASVETLMDSGSSGCADFREEGIGGVAAFRKAVSDIPFGGFLFGRDGGEETADGLGVSSVRDVSGIENIVASAKSRGLPVAFHAGERDALDIDEALSFEPSLLIHCTHATPAQLRRCVDQNVPIAICPRSNWLLGVASGIDQPPVRRMIDTGCTIWLGTDNAMFVQPDMTMELSFLTTVYRVDPIRALRAATEGRRLWGRSPYLEQGADANFFVVDPARSNLRFTRDLRATCVKRLNTVGIVKKVYNWPDQLIKKTIL